MLKNNHICPDHGYHNARVCFACRLQPRRKWPTAQRIQARREATEAKQWVRGMHLRKLGVA